MKMLHYICNICDQSAVKPRSCVDFKEIMCQFLQVFIGVQLRFEKSSPRWRM